MALSWRQTKSLGHWTGTFGHRTRTEVTLHTHGSALGENYELERLTAADKSRDSLAVVLWHDSCCDEGRVHAVPNAYDDHLRGGTDIAARGLHGRGSIVN